jgi:hypothetical protein
MENNWANLGFIGQEGVFRQSRKNLLDDQHFLGGFQRRRCRAQWTFHPRNKLQLAL